MVNIAKHKKYANMTKKVKKIFANAEQKLVFLCKKKK